jgi:hypothetical protein
MASETQVESGARLADFGRYDNTRLDRCLSLRASTFPLEKESATSAHFSARITEQITPVGK